jgi:hypothetical protein
VAARYAALLGPINGVRLVEDLTLSLATQPRRSGVDLSAGTVAIGRGVAADVKGLALTGDVDAQSSPSTSPGLAGRRAEPGARLYGHARWLAALDLTAPDYAVLEWSTQLAPAKWVDRMVGDDLEAWRFRAQDSILDVNGIVSAGYCGGLRCRRRLTPAPCCLLVWRSFFPADRRVAGARYTEVRTEWEMSRALLEAERASIEADATRELEELVGLYEAKGLSHELARQVAEALTERNPVACYVRRP